MPEKLVIKLTPHNDGKKRKMVMTGLTAIALCEQGANQHAHATFFKSVHKPGDKKKKKGDMEKRYLLTSAASGHTHIVSMSDFEIVKMGGDTSWQDDHSHPFVIADDGSITVGEIDGHTHTMESLAKDFEKNGLTKEQMIAKLFASESGEPNAAEFGGGQEHEENIMPDKAAEKLAKETADKAKKEHDATKALLATATAIGTLTDAQKNYYNGLEDAGKVEFLAKDATQRQVEIVNSIEKDAVVYKAENGTIFRKSDDPRLAVMAKEIDDTAKTNAVTKEKAEKLALEKRVNTEFPHLAGTLEVRAAILKSVDDIPDKETRENALEALKAQNTRMAKAMTNLGHSITPDADDSVGKAATDKMDTLTKQYMVDKDEPDYFKAYEAVSKVHPETYAAAVTG